MTPLRAIEEKLILVFLGFGGGAVRVWVGDLGEFAVVFRVGAVPVGYHCGEGCGC